MAHGVHSRLPLYSQGTAYDRSARHRLRRLRHLHPLSHQRQIALVRRTRRARPAARSLSVGPVDTALRDRMLDLLPNLRAFAFSLTNDPIRVDDLVQDTFLRAWASIDHFERGSNLGAWLFTILRHAFCTDYRKRRREVEDPVGVHAACLKVLPEQDAALAHLPSRHREALLLVWRA